MTASKELRVKTIAVNEVDKESIVLDETEFGYDAISWLVARLNESVPK